MEKKILAFLIISFLSINLAIGQTGLIQHLDASIDGSIITDGNLSITTWKDQSSSQNDAQIVNGSVNKVQENGVSWLDFGDGRNTMELFSSPESDSWLDQATETGGFCVILSVKPTSFHNNWNDLIGNSSAVSSGFGIRYSNSGSIQSYLGGNTISGSNIESGEAIILAFNYSALDDTYTLWDSKSKNTLSGTISNADFSLSEPVILGGTNNPDRYFRGYIGEVKIYNSTISNENFITEQNSFFLKWVSTDSEKDAPSPNPASFHINPTGVGASIISMTATTGSDANGPVEYKFIESSGNPGGTSSEWQTNPNYRDGDLDPETSYSYSLSMRDSYGNVGTSSNEFSATTKAFSEYGLENELEYAAYYGYQGWHFAQGDGRQFADDWVHWFESNIPDALHIHGDMWPDLSEYDSENLYETQMLYPNGERAKLYSCFDYSTIDLHIKWMADYGIKGCAVQRFTSSIDKSNKLEQGDKKIRDVMTACEKYGVKFWIMHDSGQGDENEYERISNDWIHLVEDLDILQSPAYTWQNGKPVYGLWGIGVSSRQWTPQDAIKLLDFYQNGDEKYRTYVFGGVPVNWRTSPPAGWNVVFDRLDNISPWRTIFNGPDEYKTRMQEDLAYCNAHGIDYSPVVSPGASTLHLRDSDEMRNWKPRDGGHFLWKQVYEVCNMDSKFVYVAMFDEVDEGTAMYKLVETQDGLPVGADQVALNEDGYNLPSDWYLQIGTEIQKMIEGTIPITATLPINSDLNSNRELVETGILKVYPVPAGDKIFLSGHKESSPYKIVNIQGVIASEGKLHNSSIDISQLNTGMYFLIVENEVVRFIKN